MVFLFGMPLILGWPILDTLDDWARDLRFHA